MLEGGTGIHVLYVAEPFPDYGGPYPLAYTVCAGSCETAGHWTAGVVDSTLNGSAPLATLWGGAIHAIYPVYTPGGFQFVRYATCIAGCTAPSNWQRADLDTAETPLAAMTADSSGTLHVVYGRVGPTRWQLRYARCAAACTHVASWSIGTVDSGPAYGSAASIAVDGGGRLHVVYTESVAASNAYLLRYGVCATACMSAASWSFTTLDSGSLSPPSLVLRHGTTVFVSYSADDSIARIGHCGNSCTNAAAWSFVSLAGFGWRPILGVGPTGTLYLTGEWGSLLQYARCTTDCGTASDWVRHGLSVGTVTSTGLAVNQADQPRVAFALAFDALRMALFK